MASKTTDIVSGSAEDIAGLARIPDESASPVMRVSPRGKTLYANQFSRTLEGLVIPKSNKLDPVLVNKAKFAYKEDRVVLSDYIAGSIIYEMSIVPVAEHGYVNIYGRDITENREIAARAESLAKFPNENPNPVMRAKSDGEILFANNAARSLAGITQTGPPARLSTELSHAAREAGREDHPQTINIETNDGTYLFTVSPVPGEIYVNIYGREITAEIEAQHALVAANSQLETRVAERTASVRLLQNIVLSANSAESLEAALQTALHEICIYTNWPVGHAYVVESKDGNSELIPTGIWHIETSSEVSDLRKATESMRFGGPRDLPGRVLESGREVWVERLSLEKKHKRASFLKKAGLVSGMAFPVTSDSHVIGVLEFFSQTHAPTDVEIIKTLEHVGAQLGSVAKRKQAEAAVEISRQEAELSHSRLTDALEVIGQSFVLFDKNDNIVLFNSKYGNIVHQILGREPVVGDSFETILRASANVSYLQGKSEDKERWIADTLRERKEIPERDDINQRDDGTWMRAEGYRTSDGGNVSLFTDVTEMKQHEIELDALVEELGVARDAAVDANSAKSQFLANMSHELRTPLNAIIGYAELLVDEAADDENDEYIPDLEKIQSAGQHLLGLINDILDLSKIEVGKIELYVEKFDVTDMLDDVANTIKPLVEKNNNVLEIEVGTGAAQIHGDLTKLRQNLFNLLSNAAKFSRDSKLILRAFVEKSKDKDLLVFQVADQGIGMTQEQLEKIFDPFTQADSSTSKKFGGTGLGLAITREFTRLMGGDITVASELNVGTTFTMKVLADGRKVPEPTQAIPAVRSGGVNEAAPLILIIDDDPAVRELLQRNLTTAGYRTVAAADGKVGLEQARTLSPDVITLDVLMPHTDGWAVLTALKAGETTAQIPVVMVTISEEKSLGFSLGASEFLSKPVDRKKLVNVLERFLKKKDDRTALLVEDDDATREIMRKYLENEGAIVIEAENGRVAIEKLEETTPSIILLDLMMPELDGFGFVEEYRKRPEWHQVPIIVITAQSLSTAEKAKLEGWVEGFYSKLDTDIETVLKDVSALLPPHKGKGS